MREQIFKPFLFLMFRFGFGLERTGAAVACCRFAPRAGTTIPLLGMAFYVLSFTQAFSLDHYAAGNITNFAVRSEYGLLVKSDTPVPECQGTPSGWMLVPESEQVMISIILSFYHSGIKTGVFYVDDFQNQGLTYCVINQWDPTE